MPITTDKNLFTLYVIGRIFDYKSNTAFFTFLCIIICYKLTCNILMTIILLLNKNTKIS